MGTRVTLVRGSPPRAGAERGSAAAEGDIDPPSGAAVMDAGGQFVTPRLFDAHSHLGGHPTPGAAVHLDGSEREPEMGPVAPQAQSADAFWPQDPGIERAVAGGVTTIQVLSGSGNLIRWCAVTMELRPGIGPSQMLPRWSPERVTVAPGGLKVACGENPKRSYGEDKRAPRAGLGNLALQRAAFLKTKKLQTDWARWRDEESPRIATEAKTPSPARPRSRNARHRRPPPAKILPLAPLADRRRVSRRAGRGEPPPLSSPPPATRAMARQPRAAPPCQEGVAAGAGKRTTPPGAASVPQTKPRIRRAEPLVALSRVARDELGGATVAQATALPPLAPFAPFGRPARDLDLGVPPLPRRRAMSRCMTAFPRCKGEPARAASPPCDGRVVIGALAAGARDF